MKVAIALDWLTVIGGTERVLRELLALYPNVDFYCLVEFLADLEAVILIGAGEPVGFFAYPGKPGHLLPQGCEILEQAGISDDLPHTRQWLADKLRRRGPFLIEARI